MVKVLQISSYPPPRAGWGMRVFFLKKELEKRGCVCKVMNIGKGRFLTGRDFIPVFGGLDYIVKIIRYRLRGYLIHMHLNGDSPKGFILTIIALIISIITFRRPIVTFHAGPVQKYFPQSRGPKLNPMYKFIFTVPRYIICNNNAVKENIESYGVNSKKIIPIQAFSKQYLEYKHTILQKKIEKFIRNHDEIICSYVFFRPEFFLDQLIECIKEIVNRRKTCGLIIIGSDLGCENSVDLINKYNLNDYILLAGDQDHDSFLTIMSLSKVYLRTPIKDGVCSSVLEALSLGIPVVASENGSRPKSVVTYKNENIGDMVEKIVYVLNNHKTMTDKIIKPIIQDTIINEIEILEKS